MKKRNQHLFSLLVRFTFGFFMITFFSAMIIMAIGAFLIELGWLQFPSPFTIIWIAFLASAILGSLATLIVGRRFLSNYAPIEAALARIGQGDFSVHLDETEGSALVQKTSHDINAAAAHLRQVEIMRRDFIADFSHEFKTPIVSVQGFAKRLLDRELTETQRSEYATIIYEESKRLATLAENTLLMNRLDSISVFPDIQEFFLDENIRKAIILLEKQWEAKKLVLDLILPNMPFMGSETMLKEVWINLLTNAIKFAPNGSILSVSAQVHEAVYIIKFTNQGPAIPLEKQARIFDKFYQGNEVSSLGGNGLGLSIVKRIIELSNSDIQVTSNGENGTTFTVSLTRQKS